MLLLYKFGSPLLVVKVLCLAVIGVVGAVSPLFLNRFKEAADEEWWSCLD